MKGVTLICLLSEMFGYLLCEGDGMQDKLSDSAHKEKSKQHEDSVTLELICSDYRKITHNMIIHIQHTRLPKPKLSCPSCTIPLFF